MENCLENKGFVKKEWVARCPHCGNEIGKKRSYREIKGDSLGMKTEEFSICENEKCKEEIILDRVPFVIKK